MKEDNALILEPGSMRDQVVIQRPTYTKDASGTDVVAWHDFLSAKANVNSPKARKFFAAGRMEVEKVYPVEMWYQAGIDETMRMIYAGRALEILTVVDHEGRHRVLYLACREVT